MQTKLILLMKENHLSNQWLADLLEISAKQASKKVNGEAPFKSDEMFKISDYFNKTLDEIFLHRMYDKRT